MSIFRKIFGGKSEQENEIVYKAKSFGEILSEETDGANLVDGKQTWEYAQKKHDIEVMKKCCDAEIKTMEKANIVPAPYYFERVAILSRKEKKYQQEIDYCEMYLKIIDEFYRRPGAEEFADARKGPTYQSIKKRLSKAKELLKKSHT